MVCRHRPTLCTTSVVLMVKECECGNVFVKTGRREFCSTKFQKRVYMRLERAQERQRRETGYVFEMLSVVRDQRDFVTQSACGNPTIVCCNRAVSAGGGLQCDELGVYLAQLIVEGNRPERRHDPTIDRNPVDALRRPGRQSSR